MNPWSAGLLAKSQSFIRFSLWICLAINCGMLCIFSIFFAYEFLRHLWNWCDRVMFSNPW